jgi:hypothetical protein
MLHLSVVNSVLQLISAEVEKEQLEAEIRAEVAAEMQVCACGCLY